MHKFSTSHAALAGLSGSLVGIGLGRFAYTPLIPPLIDAGWFPPSQVVYLGAANLAGYLAGALLARPMAAHLRASHILRAMMLLASAACFACAAPLSLPWFFAWRFAAGLAGGVIMVLAAPTILPHVDPAAPGAGGGIDLHRRRPWHRSVRHAGAAAAAVRPGGDLVRTGRGLARADHAGLGRLAGHRADRRRATRNCGGPSPLWRSGGLLAEYGLNAAGLVPHMVFLVDFVARGLHAGLTVGAGYWVVFGVGAMAGPLLAGALADRIGFGVALRVAFATQAVAVVLPVLTDATPWLVVSSALAGAFTPGIVPLALGRVHELLPGNPVAQRLVWGRTTMAWALFQAGAAYFDSWLFGQTGGDYRLLFALGAGALTLALTIDLVAGRQSAAAATPPIRPSSA